MISFEGFTVNDYSPVYQQIVNFIKQSIASGAVENGDEMPSRRVLASLLGINPNTVQKAFKILEDEELIVSHAGAKSLISVDEKKVELIRFQLINYETENLITNMKRLGVSKDEAISMIEKLWQ